MRKYLIMGLSVFMLMGCSTVQPQKEVMTCNMEQNNRDHGTMEVASEFEYDKGKDIILNQKQHSQLAIKDKETYDKLVQHFKDTQEAKGYDKIKGVKYTLENNDNDLSIDEIIEIDFNEITGDDYNTMANGQTNAKGSSNPNVLATETKKNLESVGFVCKVS